VKSMPMFVEKLKKIDENMEQLHKLIPEPVEKNDENKNGEKPPASLPPTIAEQREKNGLPPLNSSVQEDKKGPVPLTIAEQREKNGLPPMNSNKDSANAQKNSPKGSLPPTIAELQATNVPSENQKNTKGPEANAQKNSPKVSLPPTVSELQATNVPSENQKNTKEPNVNAQKNSSAPLPSTIGELQAKTVNNRKPLPPLKA
jgi:hypothetical protein